MSSRKNKNFLDIVPIYSPRTTYSQIKSNDEKMIADMTLNFDKITIGLLKEQFQKKNGKLMLQEFIVLSKKHLKFWQPSMPNRDQLLARYLTQLFNEIDINGNGNMQLKQFTNYIIEKAIVLKNLKSKTQQIKRYVKSDIEPKLKIEGVIQKAQYIKDLQKMAFFEQGSNKIYFMDLKDGRILQKALQVDPKKLVISISSIKKNKVGKVQIRKKDLQIPTDVRVLDILYLNDKKYNTFLVSTSDGYVRGWKYTQNGFVLATQPDNQEEIFQHYFNSEIYSMSWDSVNEVLYCGQKSGSIYMWNLKTDLQKPLYEHQSSTDQKQNVEQKINLMITCMITMPKLQFMASGRMDGKLILWDTINNKKKWVYRQHTRGILSLAFNESMILLFSSGFDHKICVWNPYISTLIHKIEIHLAPILSLKVIQSSNQLISLDSEGVVKITDTKRFHGIYTFSLQKQDNNQMVPTGSNGYNLSSFIVIDKPLKLVFIGKSISIYEYDKNYNPLATDENVVVACKYIQEMLSFVTASGNKIKLWSALNGDITKIFIDITEHQITAMALDSLKKRIIVGDNQGSISVHNVLNGAKMKHLTKHNCEILSIETMKNEVEMLITCSIDNEIRIFKEVDDNYQLVRYIYFRNDIQITQLKYQTRLKLMMIGTNVGTVGFYDTQTGKNIGNCLNKNLQEITSLCQTNQAVIITTTAIGNINIFATPPSNNRFQKILSFIHVDSQKQGRFPLGITHSCYNQKDNYLYILDDKKYFTCYDLKQIKNYKDEIRPFNNESQEFNTSNKNAYKPKISIKWQIRTNHETIRQVEYIPEQNIICTSSFDKKVKIWNAYTGQYIDSLQQNYNKAVPEPIAYYDTRNYILYNKTKKKAIDRVQIDINKLQFECQDLQKLVQKYDMLGQEQSNKQWNLKVKVQKKQKFQNCKFQEFTDKPTQQQKPQRQSFNKICHQSLHSINPTFSISKIKNSLQKFKSGIKQVQKQLNKQNLDFQEKSSSYLKTDQSFYKAPTTRQKSQIKRSMMKRIQNCLNQPDQKQKKSQYNKQNRNTFASGVNKIRDYTPIYQVLGLKQKKRAYEQHQKVIQTLYKTQTLSRLNRRQQEEIFLGQEQAKATKKLCQLLIKIDETDKRPKTLLKSIKLKNVSQSVHSNFTSGLPKI